MLENEEYWIIQKALHARVEYMLQNENISDTKTSHSRGKGPTFQPSLLHKNIMYGWICLIQLPSRNLTLIRQIGING